MMEQRDVGGDEVALGREMRLSQPVEPRLIKGGEAERDDQRRRWLALTRDILPGMAAVQRWPIRFDHCFMRVLLDNAVGDAWPRLVPRPAIRHLTKEQLGRAIALGESVLRDPALLPALNRRSLDWRRRSPV